MNKLLLACIFVVCQLAAAGHARAQACPPAPVVRAAVFNTDGYYRVPEIQARAAALATQLPQVAQNLDVMCLNDLRAYTGRNAALANLDRNVWNVYQPPRLPGCRNACETNISFTAMGSRFPINKWFEYCTLTPDPSRGGAKCGQAATSEQYEACIKDMCPFIAPPVAQEQCNSCVANPVAGEPLVSRVLRCTGSYDLDDTRNCNDAGATIASRYPFLATDYRRFPIDSVGDSDVNFGVDNWGVSYAQVQTPMGRAHLFCSSQAAASTPAFDNQGTRLRPDKAQQLNLVQTQDLLDYIRTKTNGEPAIVMGDMGSGPALASSATGPAQAQWTSSFALLQSAGLVDALASNIGANAQPAPAAACTFGCGTPEAAYSSHIMTSGTGKTPQGNDAALCARNGGTLLVGATAATASGTVPVSRHVGLRSDIALQYRAVPAINWGAPASLVFGSALGSAQLNATAGVPGVFSYSPAAGTVLPIGANQALQVTFTPNDLVNYQQASSSNTISVTAASGTAANLVVQRSLSRDASGNVVVKLTVANNGGSAAAGVSITSVKLGSAAGAPTPLALGAIAAGGTASSSHTIANSSTLATGTSSTLSVAGTYVGSSFNSSSRVSLP